MGINNKVGATDEQQKRACIKHQKVSCEEVARGVCSTVPFRGRYKIHDIALTTAMGISRWVGGVGKAAPINSPSRSIRLDMMFDYREERTKT